MLLVLLSPAITPSFAMHEPNHSYEYEYIFRIQFSPRRKCNTIAMDRKFKNLHSLTVSRHLLMHCLPPIGEHGNSVSCSCNSAGFPVGGSGDPFLNWPDKNTPQVQDAWSAFGNINPSGIFNLINSFSSTVFACDAVDNLMLIMQNATNTNWDTSISTVIRSFYFSSPPRFPVSFLKLNLMIVYTEFIYLHRSTMDDGLLQWV